MEDKTAFSLLIGLILCLMSFQCEGCGQNCEDKPELTPSRLVVKFGDPFSVTCSVCQHACNDSKFFDIEAPIGVTTTNESAVLWRVDQMTEWDISPSCFYTIMATNVQCCTPLPVTVYKPLSAVSFSFVNHTGPMLEGLQYTLQCTVEDVAPLKNLNVTFYRGQTALDHLQSSKTTLTPETETFTLSITPSKEDDGVQYWCEAKLELGPEGPQPPPVVTSQKNTATVHYKPHKSNTTQLITVTEGERLELDCSAVGNPSPSYNWLLPSSKNSSSNSSLIIDPVKSEHEGEYSCSVSNSVGEIVVKFKVDVKARPGPPSLDITAIIISVAVIVVLAVAAVLLYHFYYKHNRMGQYNLKDVFRLHARHTAVPMAE